MGNPCEVGQCFACSYPPIKWSNGFVKVSKVKSPWKLGDDEIRSMIATQGLEQKRFSLALVIDSLYEVSTHLTGINRWRSITPYPRSSVTIVLPIHFPPSSSNYFLTTQGTPHTALQFDTTKPKQLQLQKQHFNSIPFNIEFPFNSTCRILLSSRSRFLH